MLNKHNLNANKKDFHLPSLILSLLAVSTIISACSLSDTQTQELSDETPLFLPPLKEQTPTLLPTPIIYQSPFTTWIDPTFPAGIREELGLLDSLEITNDKNGALVKFQPDSNQLVGKWFYLAVVPFHSFLDSITSSDLLASWRGELNSASEVFVTQDTLTALAPILGESDSSLKLIDELDDIVRADWDNPNIIAIIPFEDLNLDWKVLAVDGNDPLSSQFSQEDYFLTVPISFQSEHISPAEILLDSSITNYDPDQLSSVALTGVTALVRDTAVIMEEKGLTYPAGDIRELLQNASITHISNEVPFAVDCPDPDSSQPSLYFCSKDSYLELLEDVGTDIVELSGDHFGDWGPEAMLHSLDLYHSKGWITYGGGETLQAGLAPKYIQHNGNKFAFISCNGKAHEKYATATDTNPGASACDYEWMITEISRLDGEGYIVIVTLQHEEVDSFSPYAIQVYDFGQIANAGAAIVSGSQAHHPQAFNYTGRTFIHYGLGNLFFDQWYIAYYNSSEHVNKDKAFIDLHYFYAGEHVNTRLYSLQFIDNARPRFMTDSEKQIFLEEVFLESKWRDERLIPYPW